MKFRAALPHAKAPFWFVDAAQGVEAQTVANVHLAHKQGLTIIPITTRSNLPNADVASVHRQLEEILAILRRKQSRQARRWDRIEEILEAIVKRIRHRKNRRMRLCALSFLIPYLTFIAAWSATCV